jgi:hypothetical protein
MNTKGKFEVWNKGTGDYSDGTGNLVSLINAKRFETHEQAEKEVEHMRADYPDGNWIISEVTY